MRGLQPCGTYAAYQRHRMADEKPCEPCRLARNAYQLARRNRNGSYREHNKKQNRSRGRALTRLIRAYPDVFAALYAEELGREGVE